MSELGSVEDEIFKKRQQNELAFKQREKDKKRRLLGVGNNKPKWIPTGQFAPTVCFKFSKVKLISIVVSFHTYIFITAYW